MRRLRLPRARVAEVQLRNGERTSGTRWFCRQVPGCRGRGSTLRQKMRSHATPSCKAISSAFPWAKGSPELVCAGVHEIEMELLRFTWSRRTFIRELMCLLATGLMARVTNNFSQ